MDNNTDIYLYERKNAGMVLMSFSGILKRHKVVDIKPQCVLPT